MNVVNVEDRYFLVDKFLELSIFESIFFMVTFHHLEKDNLSFNYFHLKYIVIIFFSFFIKKKIIYLLKLFCTNEQQL